MEAPVAAPKSAHLMCGKPFWSVAGFVVCVYFSYTSYTDLRDGDFFWQNGWWNVLTWAVWFVLIAGLASETRCWREGIFFGLLLAIFAIGLVFSAWSTAPHSIARQAREASIGLWTLAALSSLTTFSHSAHSQN